MNPLWRSGCVVLALLAVAGQAAVFAEDAAAPAAAEASADQAKAPTAEDQAGGDIAVHGFIRSRYRARWTDGASDQDLYETLSLDLGDPDRNRITAHFLGDVSIDLDGSTSQRGSYVYDSVRDSKGSDVVPLVYSCYVDLHRIGALSIFRAGRQSIYETPEVSFFDGLRMETEELGPCRLKLGGYGGVPVHLYRDYSSGDIIGGTYGEARLWSGARTRVDYQHIEGHSDAGEFANNLIAVGGWQRIGRHVDLHGNYTVLDDDGRDVLARATWNQPEWDFRLQVSYYQLMAVRRRDVIEADAYYPILKDYEPYSEYRWMASKGFGEHLNIDAGMDIRRLTRDEQASEFNHEFERYFATVDIYDIWKKGTSLSLTGEQWSSNGRRSESEGVDLTCPLGSAAKISLGTAYYLYKYDDASDQEHDDVQTYYAKVGYAHSRTWRFNADYTLEDDGGGELFNELRCEAICSF